MAIQEHIFHRYHTLSLYFPHRTQQYSADSYILFWSIYLLFPAVF